MRYRLLMVMLFCLLMYPAALRAASGQKLQLPPLPSLDRPEKIALPFGQKPFILHVFASWCGICGVEAPLLAEYARQLPVPLYGIAYRDIPADTARWLQRFGSPYAMVLSDNDGILGDLAGVTGTPETMLIDRSGTVVWHYSGMLEEATFQQELLPLAEKLLK